MVVLEPQPQALRKENAERDSSKIAMRQKKQLTSPDLVLLSLLAERPMHGYEANLELERRCIRDWAEISRPQVYYSLEKLAAAGFIRKTHSSEAASGPERIVLDTSPRRSRRCSGARRLDYSPGSSRFSHLDRAFLARSPGRFPKAASTPAQVR